MENETAVLVTLITYKVVLIGFGLLSQRRTKDGVDFFLGGRKLGPLVAAISASASSSSGWTLLSVSGLAYAKGIHALWLFPACVGGFFLNWAVVAPRLRRITDETGAVTLTEVLAGPAQSARSQDLRRIIVTLASVICIFSLGCYVASQFQSAGKTFSETFGLADSTSILIGAAVVLLYTLLGGFWAVSLTDTLQGLLMALTAVLLPIFALVEVGGFGPLFENLRTVDTPGYMSWLGEHGLTVGIGAIIGFLGIGLGYPGQPHVVNRFMALKQGDAALRRARFYAIAWAVVVYSGMLLLGLCARVLFEGAVDREKIFITATNQLFHPVIAGIMIAAILSAIMSTADSQLLVAASSVTHDLGVGAGSTRTMLFRSRLVVLAIGGLAVALALVFLKNTTIFKSVLFAWSAMGAAFGPLLLVTILRGPVAQPQTLIAMIVGFGLSVIAYLADWPGASAMWENVVPSSIAFAIAWTGTRRP